ncbi:MAG: TonB-dependent receptor [Pseudomonadota bacterium]|nr:TonB-dependent receptor [Pseudomonadota bacterium]
MSHRLSPVVLALLAGWGISSSSELWAEVSPALSLQPPILPPPLAASMQEHVQQQAVPQQASTLGMITVTATRPETEIGAIPKTVVTAAEMQHYGDSSVADTLRRAAGIQIGAGGRPDRSRFRGLNAAPTILINGEQVQGGRRGATSLIDTFTPEMIERIEITRQASVSEGSVASGGVINIILKQPLDDQLSGVVKLGYGQVTQGVQAVTRQQAMAQIEGKKNDLSVTLSANLHDSEQQTETHLIRADGMMQTQRQHSETQFRMLSPRLSYELYDEFDSRLFADVFYSEHDSASISSTAQQQTSESLRLNLRLEQTDGQRKDKWRLSIQRQHEQQHTYRDAQWEQIDESTREYSASYAGEQKIGTAHQLKFGLETRQATLDITRDADLTEQRHALYLEENWRLQRKHTLTVGLRQEWLDRSGLVDYQQSSLSPVLAYRYQMNPAWSWQLGYNQSQRTPKTDDLLPTVSLATQADAGSLNNPDRGGNPNLKPERIQALESVLGYNTADGGFNLTVFQRDISDYIEKVVLLEQDRYVERPQNQANAEASGVELTGRWAMPQRNGHTLMLNGQISTLRAEIERLGQPNRRASDVAPYSASVGVSYQYQPWQWSNSLNLGYQPSYSRPVDDQPLIRQVNARTSLDISTTKRFKAGWALTLAGRNLLATDRIETLQQLDGRLLQRRAAQSLSSVLLTAEKNF